MKKAVLLVCKAYLKAEETRQELSGDANPQTVEMRIRAEERAQVLSAVYEALHRADFCMLKILAGE